MKIFGGALIASFILNKQKRKKFRTKHCFRLSSFYDQRSYKDVTNTYQNISYLYQEHLQLKYVDATFDVEQLLSCQHPAPTYLSIDRRHHYLNLLLNCEEWRFKSKIFNVDKYSFCWEIHPTSDYIDTVWNALNNDKKIIFVGDSFLRSINTPADSTAIEKYKRGISFTFDDLTCFFDATHPSRMEQMLNDKHLIISDAQKKRARTCIDKIIATNLTKYNSQPIFEPNIGRKCVKKILVVDQSYGDMSIAKGWANDETFEQMLHAAITENPDADIIIKTHPDTIAGRGGYFTGTKSHGNIYAQTEPINPISLIKYVDKVYVCTTQFGFEALMCEKEVHVFGMPFYANWGLTHDRQKCERRINTRTLEEIFYIAYIMYSFYANPAKQCRCEIEEAMDYLLNLRTEYFDYKKKKSSG